MTEAIDEAAQVSALIGDIYDAALDRSLWLGVLEKTCNYVQGACAGLLAQNTAVNSGQFYFSWGLDPHFERLYIEKYVRLNQAAIASHYLAKVGEILSTEALIPYTEYLASRFHLEWAGPQGYCDFVGAILERSGSSIANIGVIRHQRHGLVDDATRRRMARLIPHFSRAVAIGKVIDLHTVEAAAFADTLDGLAAAMLLVDGGGRIVHANAAGSAMLDSKMPDLESMVRAADGNLTIVNAVLHRIFANAKAGDAAIGGDSIAVPLAANDGERYVAHVLPLVAGARKRAGVAYSAVAAVFISKATLDLPHPLATLADAFKLTPAEMRVLMMIVQVGGVPEVAPILGISETTVKTHLQHIFAKTGTARQADLVKLVAGYMSPLADTGG